MYKRQLSAFLNSDSPAAKFSSMENDLRELKILASAIDARLEDRYLIGSIKVLSTDHASKIPGQYFNFEIKELDRLIGNEDWSGTAISILSVRAGKLSKGILWRQANGGTKGDGHGRWDDGSAAPGQWKVGDTILIFGNA